MLHEAAAFLRTNARTAVFAAQHLASHLQGCVAAATTHLCKVVYESQVGLLQLCAGQGWQGVGIVQLPAVV